MTNQIAKLDQARTLLAECSTIDEAKQILNMAEAARHYAHVQQLGTEASNYANEIKLQAARKIGEMLLESDKNKGGNPNLTSSRVDTSSDKEQVPKLSDMGITKTQSSSWQAIAKIPKATFEAHIQDAKGSKKELTFASVVALSKQVIQSDKKPSIVPSGVFQVLYADPPWRYDNTGVHGAAADHYPTMELDKIASLLDDNNIQVAKNSVLFMWVTNPFLQDAFQVIEAWGFEYKTNVVWIKTDLIKPGSGFYVRGRHELLFICTRGSFTPLDKNISPPIGSIIEAPVQEHSRKPDEAYSIIERLYPDTTRLELFARRKDRAGWEFWGNE